MPAFISQRVQSYVVVVALFLNRSHLQGILRNSSMWTITEQARSWSRSMEGEPAEIMHHSSKGRGLGPANRKSRGSTGSLQLAVLKESASFLSSTSCNAVA